ncbi:MAG: hypothetical protein ACKN9E_01015 [Microcystaceae cyanobacterium]
MKKSQKNHSTSQSPNQNTTIEKNNHLALSTIYPYVSELGMFEIRSHALNELNQSLEKLEKIISEIKNLNINTQDSSSIINYQNSLITFKNLFSNSICYLSVILNITDCELNDDHKNFSEKTIIQLQNYLAGVNKLMDSFLTAVVHDGPVLGINIEPDKQKFSELKATLSKVTSKLEVMHQENREVELDWEVIEQEAYERMEDNDAESISVERFLNQSSDFEKKIEIARRGMKKYRNTLIELAK